MSKSLSQQYVVNLSETSVPSKARNAELSEIIQRGDGEDRDMAVLEMVNGHRRLVLGLTKRYASLPNYIDTLFDAHYGLIKAVLTYEHRKGSFSAWATSKILTEIRNGMLSRGNSPLSVTRYASEIAFKIRKIQPDKNGEIAMPDMPVVKLAMSGIMDAIALYDENGNAVDIVDKGTRSAFDEVEMEDLVELIATVIQELGMTNDDVVLVSESCGKSNEGSAVNKIALERGVTKQTVRMTRSKLLWRIRRRLLHHLGEEEYLSLSSIGALPGRSWRSAV